MLGHQMYKQDDPFTILERSSIEIFDRRSKVAPPMQAVLMPRVAVQLLPPHVSSPNLKPSMANMRALPSIRGKSTAAML